MFMSAPSAHTRVLGSSTNSFARAAQTLRSNTCATMSAADVELQSAYEEVIEEVINGIRDLFKEDGVDMSVLENLKEIWKTKLQNEIIPKENELESVKAGQASNPPLQLILRLEPIPQPARVNEALEENVLSQTASSSVTSVEKLPQSCMKTLQLQICQTDGENDSEEDSSSEAEMNSVEEQLEESDPLNSNDDLSDQEEDAFETDNVIVCQYERISRRFNKWKLFLKSGIMNINGVDHVFKWLVGEADW